MKAVRSSWASAGHPSDRTAGIHLTDVLDSLENSLGYGPDPERDWADVGFLFEEAMLAREKESVIVPGEIVADGIAMTVDGLRLETVMTHPKGGRLKAPTKVVEYKARWKSARNLDIGDPQWWRILCQVKSYCRAWETNLAELYFLFMNGDWRPPAPMKVKFDLEFTDEELERNWRMITGEARRRGWI